MSSMVQYFRKFSLLVNINFAHLNVHFKESVKSMFGYSLILKTSIMQNEVQLTADIGVFSPCNTCYMGGVL
jgi:hypothetical protein